MISSNEAPIVWTGTAVPSDSRLGAMRFEGLTGSEKKSF